MVVSKQGLLDCSVNHNLLTVSWLLSSDFDQMLLADVAECSTGKIIDCAIEAFVMTQSAGKRKKKLNKSPHKGFAVFMCTCEVISEFCVFM